MSAVSTKTAILVHEGKSPKQAYAMANAMSRAHRLTASGGYRRVKPKRRGSTLGDRTS